MGNATFWKAYKLKSKLLGETQAGIKIAKRNINNLRCANDTPLW